jgi:hypothetical protein
MVASILPLGLLACSPKAINSATTEAYEYPVKPGTDAWRAFTTHEEMLKACQIPESTLRTVSTEGLVETVLNYPLYDDVLAYNSPQQGFDAISSEFNGIPELLNRQDAGTVLLAKFKAVDPTAIGEDWTDLQKGCYVFNLIDIETLLAQQAIISNLGDAQYPDLVRECLVKINTERQSEMYGGISKESCLWVIARVLQYAIYEPFIRKVAADRLYQDFVARGFYATDDVENDIYAQAEEYLALKGVKYKEPTIVGALAENIQYTSREEWITQRKDSTNSTAIALIKYDQAIAVYTSKHPEVELRSDWGVDYTGELKILTDLGVEGLPGLLKEADLNSPFLVPVIFAIDDICKTDISLIDTFSPEQVIRWKLVLNNELSAAKDIIAKVVETLKNNPSVSDEEINNQLADAGIFALPYFYDEVISNSNVSLLKYAEKILPDEKLKEFNIASGSQDSAVYRRALESSTDDINIIKNLSVK